LNLRKLGKYMERKRREEEKTSPILTFIIKIELVFFLRVDYVPLPLKKMYYLLNYFKTAHIRNQNLRYSDCSIPILIIFKNGSHSSPNR
ncbi:hypothetical protein ACYSNR_18520, partial [Enterococcus sp. LJL128]